MKKTNANTFFTAAEEETSIPMPDQARIDRKAEPQKEMTEDEKFLFVAERILREHRAAFEELAK